jgi:hypothetical protein
VKDRPKIVKISGHRSYEGRLQSSWTRLITPSRNFVEVRWQCLFQVPPLASDTLRTTLYPLLVNLLQRSELNSVFGLEKVDLWNPIRTSAIQSRSRPMRFLGFSNHEKGAPRQEISKWSTVCSTFSGSGWSVVRSAPLAKGSTSKKRLSPHLHKVPTRSNKVSPRNFQTALVPVPARIYCRVSSISLFSVLLLISELPKYEALVC